MASLNHTLDTSKSVGELRNEHYTEQSLDFEFKDGMQFAEFAKLLENRGLRADELIEKFTFLSKMPRSVAKVFSHSIKIHTAKETLLDPNK